MPPSAAGAAGALRSLTWAANRKPAEKGDDNDNDNDNDIDDQDEDDDAALQSLPQYQIDYCNQALYDFFTVVPGHVQRRVGTRSLFLLIALVPRSERVDRARFSLEFLALLSGLMIFVAQAVRGNTMAQADENSRFGVAAAVASWLSDLGVLCFLVALSSAFAVVLYMQTVHHGGPEFVGVIAGMCAPPYLLFLTGLFVLMFSMAAQSYVSHNSLVSIGGVVLVGLAMSGSFLYYAVIAFRILPLVLYHQPLWLRAALLPILILHWLFVGPLEPLAAAQATRFRAQLEKHCPDIIAAMNRAPVRA